MNIKDGEMSSEVGTCNVSNDKQIKALLAELADKDQALILAAQFGNNLIEEKENLERQMEGKVNNIESLEQESFELKRRLESMRNEYETKLYELTQDLNLVNKKLRQNDETKSSHEHDSNEQLMTIQDLRAENQKLTEEIKISEMKFAAELEVKENLELKLQEKDQINRENLKMLSNFQKEVTKLMNKQQDLEYALMQSCNENDKQSKLIEELTKKYIIVENEKNEIDHLVFQQENEILNLQRVNQDLIYKLEKLELHSNALNRKRRSLTTNNLSQFESSINQSTNNTPSQQLKSHLNSFNKRNENSSTNANNRFFKDATESFNGGQHQANSSPFRQIDNSNFFHNRSEHESVNDLDVFNKMNEIEEDEDCDVNHEIDEDADESVEMYTKSAYLDNDSCNHFLGAVNWQQEAIEQNLEEGEDEDADENFCENQRDQHHEDDSQGNQYRSMEEDSNHSLLN